MMVSVCVFFKFFYLLKSGECKEFLETLVEKRFRTPYAFVMYAHHARALCPSSSQRPFATHPEYKMSEYLLTNIWTE